MQILEVKIKFKIIGLVVGILSRKKNSMKNIVLNYVYDTEKHQAIAFTCTVICVAAIKLYA